MIIIEQNFIKTEIDPKTRKTHKSITNTKNKKCKLQMNNKLMQNMPQLRYIHPIYINICICIHIVNYKRD